METLPPYTKAVTIDSHSNSVPRVDNQRPLSRMNKSDVLMKLDYAGVDFVDVYQQSGLYPVQLPLTMCCPGAGTIAMAGSGVAPSLGVEVGQRGAVFTQGTIARYVSVLTGSIMVLPPSVSTRLGAAIILQGLTAWKIVHDAHKVE